MKDKHKYLAENLKVLGFNIKNKSFVECFELLFQEHVRVLMEIEDGNKSTLKREIQRSLTPTN